MTSGGNAASGGRASGGQGAGGHAPASGQGGAAAGANRGGATSSGGVSAMGGASAGATTTGGSAMGGSSSGGSSSGGAAATGGGSGTGGTAAGGGSDCPAVSDFQTWPSGKSPAEIGGHLVDNYLGRAPMDYHYSDACAWYGALGFTKVVNDTTNNQKLVKKFDQFLNGKSYFPSSSDVDSRVGGIVPLELAIQTKDMKYAKIGLVPADATVQDINTNLAGIRHWSDDMFMITALLVQAYRATSDVKYRDAAAKAMVDYLGTLQQPNGLFRHNRDSRVEWGRANGWFAVGMAELLQEMPAGAQRDTIMTGYTKMMAGLKSVQIAQTVTADSNNAPGMWRQILDDSTSFFESSCSAMFTYSIATGVRKGWLSASDYAAVARNGWLGVVGQLDGSWNLKNVCEGTGSPAASDSDATQKSYYLMRKRETGDLHGQAPVMWSASTFLRAYTCGAP